jgi:hypothetical protein
MTLRSRGYAYLTRTRHALDGVVWIPIAPGYITELPATEPRAPAQVPVAARKHSNIKAHRIGKSMKTLRECLAALKLASISQHAAFQLEVERRFRTPSCAMCLSAPNLIVSDGANAQLLAS